MSETTKKSKPIVCVVVSDKMNKSRVGVTERLIKHPTYKKYLRRNSKIMFHDEKNETKVNDRVQIVPSRPLSTRKKFTLVNIIESAEK